MGSIPLSDSPDLPSLVSQLTTEEKISLLAGQNFWTTKDIPRVGIPALKVSDGPNGARGGLFAGGPTSACFPAGVALASSFDRKLVARVGEALAAETKSKGASVLLGPTVCPHRDPRGGRNFESFSEDPLLAGELAAQYITALQKAGVGASIKHFAVNEQETKRFTMDVHLSQRALREIYLKPFEIAIKNARPWTVMTSYNLINGTHADMNEFLIEKVLRKEWGFHGLVVSDWGGTNSTAESLNAGHDLEMPGPAVKRTTERVTKALKSGALSVKTLDQRVLNVLELLERADKFNDPDIPEEQEVDRPQDRALIRQAGAEAMVLLKNNGDILPLQKDKVKSIAMIGLAKEYMGHGGGSAAVNSHHKISPWEAFTETLEGSSVELKYAEGARILRNLNPLSEDVVDEEGKPGFTVRLFNSVNDSSPTVSNSPGSKFMSIERQQLHHVEMTGTFTPTISGNHYISFATVGDTRVLINNEKVFDVKGPCSDIMAFLLGTATEERIQYRFEKGATYNVRIEATAMTNTVSDLSILANPLAGFNFGFSLQQVFEADVHTPAVQLAKECDVALVFVGNTPVWETEGCDRDSISLPMNGSLDRLIAGVAESNPKTIVINSTGSPIHMPWLDQVAGLLQTWFPGQEAGYSISDVVFGAVNPSGKLPVTFPKLIGNAPSYGNFPGDVDKLRVDYKEDVFVGYRYYDLPGKQEGVEFPFGFGLSYTKFEVSGIDGKIDGNSKDLVLSQGKKISVSGKVKNAGSRTGSQVVQIYAGPESSKSDTTRPKKVLAGFEKARDLQPGAEASFQVEIDQTSIAWWNEDRYEWTVDAGQYVIYVSGSSLEEHAWSKIEFEVKEGWGYSP